LQLSNSSLCAGPPSNGTTHAAYDLAGSTQKSACFFLMGGHDGSNTLKTSESAVQ
jgi:hypothetical protein